MITGERLSRTAFGDVRTRVPQDIGTLSFRYPVSRVRSDAEVVSLRVADTRRIGLIHNRQARHNRARAEPAALAGVRHATPTSQADLRAVLEDFAADGIGSLVIDGGDGTVRDVASVLARDLPGFAPLIAIVPSGKTNALALDLGIAADWTAQDAVQAIHAGQVVERAPIEVWRSGAIHPELRGFIFGAGAFVRATGLAQSTHRLGAFNGVAVGLSIAAAVGQTVLGGPGNSWRRGELTHLRIDADPEIVALQYLLLASTLSRMPLGIKPFGRLRDGLKLLRIDAPPRRIVSILPALLGGSESPWLTDLGYRRADARRIDLRLPGPFTLDGEKFEGGDLSLRQGTPIRFAIP